MRVLVTGATGGIGRSLVPLLVAAGCEVVASGRDRAIGRTLGGRFHPADLVRDDLAPLVDGVGTVVHLAARSSPWGAAEAFEADNVRATRRVLAAAVEGGATRFVHASTPAIFAERRHRLDLGSDARPAPTPINHYARTKLAAERIVRTEDRLSTLVLRPSAVLGPHDRAILPRLLRVVRRRLLPLGNRGIAEFHPTDVRDAAAAFAAGALGTASGALNVAGPHPVRIRSLAQVLATRLGRPLRFPLLPEAALHHLAGAAEAWGRLTGREPPITRYSAALLSWSRTFDLADTIERLGWRPRHEPVAALDHALAA